MVSFFVGDEIRGTTETSWFCGVGILKKKIILWKLTHTFIGLPCIFLASFSMSISSLLNSKRAAMHRTSTFKNFEVAHSRFLELYNSEYIECNVKRTSKLEGKGWKEKKNMLLPP